MNKELAYSIHLGSDKNKTTITLKCIDEEYKTTLINFEKYKNVMFANFKLMEMECAKQNKVALYLFNSIKL